MAETAEMGEMVTFASNGGTCEGYLAGDGSGPGLIVIQEWWGLVPHIKDLADRFAAEGYTVLAPDLYHSEVAIEAGEAHKLMMALKLDQAGKDLSGAVDLLRERTGRERIGTVGFCMGGGLAMVLACQRPDAVAIAVPFYGVIPWPEAQPDWAAVSGELLVHIAELDKSFSPEAGQALIDTLHGLGKTAAMHVYPGANHGFFNDTRPVYDAQAAALAWSRTLEALGRVLR